MLQDLNDKIIKHDLINKYRYKNTQELPQLKNIRLHFGCKNFNIQEFARSLLALEMVTSKKSKITASKSSNLFFKIQKGQPAGCKVSLEKKDIYKFLNKLIIENYSSEFNMKLTSSTVSFKVSHKALQELNNPFFDNLPYLDIKIKIIHPSSTPERLEIIFLLKSIKLHT